MKLKDEIVNVVIFSKNKLLAEKLKEGIKKESNFFKQNTQIIYNINDLKNIKIIDLFVFLNDKKMDCDYSDIENELSNIERVIVVDIEKNIIDEKYRDCIKQISEKFDGRSVAFSILFDYYTDLRDKHQEDRIKESMMKLDETIKKFQKKDPYKEELSDIIDLAIVEKIGYSLVGYEELKTMLMFCIINNIDIDEERNYNYIYRAIAKFHNEDEEEIPRVIGLALGSLRRRKRKLYIQDYLVEIKGRPIVEQVILLSKKIK